MESIFLQHIVEYRALGYFIVFLGMIFEGEIFLFAAVYLTFQGYFDFFDMAGVVFFGLMFGDLFWYFFGMKLVDFFPPLHRLIERIARPMDRHLHQNPLRTILISKFTYGFNHATSIRAGAVHLGLKKFMLSDFPVLVIWVAVIGGLGYLSSEYLLHVKKYVRYAEVGLLLSVLIMFAVSHLVSDASMRRLKK